MKAIALRFLTLSILVWWVAALIAQPPEGPDKGPGKKGRPPRGGPGGPPGPFEPGRVLPPPMRDQLNLTAEQQKQLDALEKDVKDRLFLILTDNQRKQLQEMRPPRPDG